MQTTLSAGFAGEFVRVRVELRVTKKLIRFVSITKNEETEYYQLQYEKNPNVLWQLWPVRSLVPGV